MQTQRSRRKSSPESSLLTPGTDLMSSMNSIMLFYAFQRNRFIISKNITIFVSDGQSPGEGELKIIDWIHTHLGASKKHVSESIVICGSDADILLQSIVQLNCSDLSVYQSSNDRSGVVCNISILASNLMSAALKNKTASNYVPKDEAERLIFSRKSSATATDNISLPPDWEVDNIQASFRSDCVLLLLLQGNDYLPKMRGCMSVTHLLRQYARTLYRLHKNERHVLDLERQTFNFKALWLLMTELRTVGDSRIPLPHQIPCGISAMYNAVARIFQVSSRDEDALKWSDESNLTSTGATVWGAKLQLMDREYSVEPKYATKRAAKTALAESVLLEIDPEAYESLLQRKETIVQRLEVLRNKSLEKRWKIDFGDDNRLQELVTTAESVDEKGESEYEAEIEEDDSLESLMASDEEEGLEGPLGSDEFQNYCSERGYLDYVSDGDIEAYLNGLLWVSSLLSRC